MARSFQDILTEAVADLTAHGYDDAQRVERWTEELRRAAQAQTTFSTAYLDEMLRNALGAIYRRLAEKGGVLKLHPGVARYTLERLKPAMRAELDRRIKASANLIRLNRDEAIRKTLHRFEGWSTSIPKGGSAAVNRTEVKAEIRKPLSSLPFAERRVLIDQGHKLTAAIHRTVAEGSGAIAARWHSHWRQSGYHYRPDHKERDGKIYLLRDSWAKEKGFVKPGPDGYYDDITAVAVEPFCRCYLTFLYNLRDLPRDMLTRKGEDALERVRITA